MDTTTLHLSASVRFILAMLRLATSMEEYIGRSIIDILKSQYPEMTQEMAQDPEYQENPGASIGHDLMNIAMRQLQHNPQSAFDAIQDFLVYLVQSDFDFKKKTKKGNPGAATWRAALNNIKSNVRTRSMSSSMKQYKRGEISNEERYADLKYQKVQAERGNKRYEWTEEMESELKDLEKKLEAELKEEKEKRTVGDIEPTKLRRKNIRQKSLDEAYGQRGEGGGAPEGGEGRIPDPGESLTGMPLDEKAAQKSFMDTLDQIVPDLKDELPLTTIMYQGQTRRIPAQRFLFEFVYEHGGLGGFSSNIKQNMGQSTEFLKFLKGITTSNRGDAEQAQFILDSKAPVSQHKLEGSKSKEKDRWPAFVGELRRDLLESIQEFTKEFMSNEEFDTLWEEFFRDITPKKAEQTQLLEEASRIGEQRKIDLRKVLRDRERNKKGLLSPAEKEKLIKLERRLTSDINEEYNKEMLEFKRNLAEFRVKQSEYIDMPEEKRPKIKRPQVPEKPLSLDEQLKLTELESGDVIRDEVEDELEEKKRRELEKQSKPKSGETLTAPISEIVEEKLASIASRLMKKTPLVLWA